MKIAYTKLYTADKQAEALEFYTTKLGFVIQTDKMFEAYRWLTLVSPDDPDGAAIMLDPNDTPEIRAFLNMRNRYVSAANFIVADVYAEAKRLTDLGIELVDTPTWFGDYKFISLYDPCGNLIELMQTENLAAF